MIHNNFTVLPCDERPKRRDGTCFYCHSPIGGEHTKECVCRSRSVVVRFSVELVIEKPITSKPDEIESQYNEGTWCWSNLAAMLERQQTCLCEFGYAKYIREATQEDHDKSGFMFEAQEQAVDK